MDAHDESIFQFYRGFGLQPKTDFTIIFKHVAASVSRGSKFHSHNSILDLGKNILSHLKKFFE